MNGVGSSLSFAKQVLRANYALSSRRLTLGLNKYLERPEYSSYCSAEHRYNIETASSARVPRFREHKRRVHAALFKVHADPMVLAELTACSVIIPLLIEKIAGGKQAMVLQKPFSAAPRSSLKPACYPPAS